MGSIIAGTRQFLEFGTIIHELDPWHFAFYVGVKVGVQWGRSVEGIQGYAIEAPILWCIEEPRATYLAKATLIMR